jgi:hypothetical protein
VSRYARKIDVNQPEIVDALRRVGCTVMVMSWCGRGVPDLHVVCPRGLMHWLEVKEPRPEGSKAKDDRTDSELEWARVVPTKVVRTVRDALEAVGIQISDAHA